MTQLRRCPLDGDADDDVAVAMAVPVEGEAAGASRAGLSDGSLALLRSAVAHRQSVQRYRAKTRPLPPAPLRA